MAVLLHGRQYDHCPLPGAAGAVAKENVGMRELRVGGVCWLAGLLVYYGWLRNDGGG